MALDVRAFRLFVVVAIACVIFTPGIVSAQSAGTIQVRALIDGRSELRLRANTVHWHHFDFDPPGEVLVGDPEPTVINRVVWFPTFPEESASCDCDSLDVLQCLEPSLPEAELSVAGGTL